MRVLYVAPKYDYGCAERGTSFEHSNFFDCLRRMGNDIIYFDSLTMLQRRGRRALNRRLSEVVRAERPDLLFSVLYYDEFDQETLSRVSFGTETRTVNWFCDDHVRFNGFSRRWAPCFNWAVTTASSAVPRYAAMKYMNVIKSQWACNPFLYRRIDMPFAHDVTFVGQAHGRRPAMVEALRCAGIEVRTWGRGWNNGRISQEEMLQVFSGSRINLNFVDFSDPISSTAVRARHFCRRWAGAVVRKVPGTAPLRELVRRVRSVAAITPGTASDNGSRGPELDDHPGVHYVAQIKGRNFEVPGCGGFMLTGVAENLCDYYRDGEEIGCFHSVADLIAKIRFYLGNDDLRNAMADRGWERTHGEHTYVHRFTQIFRQMGFQVQDAKVLLQTPPAPGGLIEVT